MPISSDDIIVFLRVLDKGSFSAAARSLGRVPSAVSMCIAMLEAELNLELFDRSGREPKPTIAALSLEPKARQVMSDMHQFSTHALSLNQGLESRLTLVITPELLSTRWAHGLARLSGEFPSLAVDVLTAPQDVALGMLHDQTAQLALLFERPNIDEQIKFAEIGTEEFMGVIASAHPRVKGKKAALTPDDQFSIRQIVVGKRERVQDLRFILSNDIWYTDTHLAALNMVTAGIGWAYLPSSLVIPLVENGTLSAMAFPEFSNTFRLWVDIVWLRRPPPGLGAARFIELLREPGAGIT